MAELKVSIMSPAKVVARTTATQVQVPGLLGYMGVLPGHARLVSELAVGHLDILGGEGAGQTYFVSGGYVEVGNDAVTILADVVERPADIDAARAEKAKQRAAERLAQKEGVDYVRAQAALARAQERLAMAIRSKT